MGWFSNDKKDPNKGLNAAEKVLTKVPGNLGNAARQVRDRRNTIDGYVDAAVNGTHHKAKGVRPKKH